MRKSLLFFVISITFLQQTQSQNAQDLLEKKRYEWNYSECGKCKENPFTFNQTIVKYFVANVYDKENRNSFGASQDEKDSDEDYRIKLDNAKTAMVSMEVFSDSTTTTKIGTIKLTQVLPTEIFVMLAFKEYDG